MKHVASQSLDELAEKCLHFAQKMHRSDITNDIQDLWQALTVERSEGLSNYFQKAWARRAYLGYYFPLYVAKINALVARLQGEGHFKAFEQEGPRILDLGSGTLAGITAFHLRFGHLERATAVDKSVSPMRLGLELLEELYPQTNWKKEVFLKAANLLGPTSSLVPPWKPNLIFFGHVLNELSEGQRALPRKIGLIEDVAKHLQDDGYVLIVEPATRSPTRELMAIRDHFASSDVLSVVAPCFGAEKCPLLMTPTSWCFSELRWSRPKSLKKIDDLIGFDREALKTSFLLLQKAPEQKSEKARVVSGTMIHGGVLRRYVCGSEGLKTAQCQVGSPSFNTLNQTLRGERLPDVLLSRSDVKIVRESERERTSDVRRKN